MKMTRTNIIKLQDFDNLVKDTYKRHYSFQQQEGCKRRGTFYFSIPVEDCDDNEMYESIPEKVNGEKMGVKFNSWVSRDPKQPIINQTQDYELELFWQRNFYPDIYTLLADLHSKGLIETGEYGIKIDW